MSVDINQVAENALAAMKNVGFDDAHVAVGIAEQDELNIAHNEPSLLRSTEDYALSLTGLKDSRKASTAITDLSPDAVEAEIKSLFERVKDAPQDEANAVSSGEVSDFTQGPMEGDPDLLAKKVEELLAFRASETPKMAVEEGGATYARSHDLVLTSQGSRLESRVGVYALSVMGTATEGDKSSSFNYTGGAANDLSAAHASELFGIGDMLRETEHQIHAAPIGDKFVGDIILAPTAVGDLIGWLLGQVSDGALIADASVFKDKVGEDIAASIFTLNSNFEAPGRAPFSGDGFMAPAMTLVDAGKLTSLLPGLYGSRKTGIAHKPTGSGWRVEPGSDAKDDLIASIKRGAMVNRLSMGSPGPNGDFSGVIKNSFLIEDGKIGTALSDSMIAGNMANMLQDISGVSKEHLDLGGQDYPWIRIPNLNFS